MPQFSYKARRPSGEVVEGALESADRAAALGQLDRMGLYPMSVQQAGGGAVKKARAHKPVARTAHRPAPRAMRARPPKMQELAGFSRQLANLLNSGMTVTTALGSMTSLEIKGIPPELIERLRQDVTEGKNLSAAMGAHPHVFSEMYINLVRAGEQSGGLVEVLRRLAEHYEKFAELRHRVTSAMVYPLFVLAVGVVMAFFFMFFMMPRFQQIFESMTGPGGKKVELPAATKLLLAASETFSNVWVMAGLVIFLVVLVVLIKRYLAGPDGRRAFDGWVLNAPLLHRIVRPNLFGQFARTLGTLMQNGVPVLTALRITEQVIDNAVIRDAIADTRDGVTDGKTIAQPLARSKVFPQLMVDMIHIGEQTGDVPGALHNVAETYEGELNVSLRVITSLIEPVLIVSIALFVGFLLFAVLSAMFKMTSTIG
ncbi:MAG: type II secretion system protein [Verrucomicrobiales bacterium]|nr:type II secretion system protein [Verrucomicrobiales bacterium]|tara:strand:+ start:12847 stop:14127 length:1281 start_codon:yes stop_codon:yes gene_type:complete